MWPCFSDRIGGQNRYMRPGSVLTLLDWVSINREVEEVRANATVVEQRVPLSWSTVADYPLAFALCGYHEVQDPALGLFDPVLELPIGRQISKSFGQLFCTKLRNRGKCWMWCVIVVACVDPKRTSMSRKLFDVEQSQSVVLEDALHYEECEVTEMFVVDRVELVLPHQLQQMGKLHCDHATGFEQDLHPGDEVINIRDMRQDIVADEEIGLTESLPDRPRARNPEEFYSGPYASLLSDLRHIRRRFNAQHWYIGVYEVLK